MGLNVIFPIFFVIAVGYILKHIGMIDENFISKSTNLVFYIALPLKTFFDMKNSEVNSIDLKYTLYMILSVIGLFLISWGIGILTIKDKNKRSAFVHCAYRSNFIYIGIPILEMIYTGDAMDSILVAIAFCVSLYNILSIILLSYYNGSKLNFLSFVIKIIKNPMIIAICLGLLAKAINFPIYSGIEDGAVLLGSLATALSLILIGGSLDFSGGITDKFIIFSSAFIKDVLAAAIIVPIGYLLGFNSGQLAVAYVLFATPCATNCFIMGKQMGSDANLTSKIVTVSFVMAIFTYSVGIGLLRTFAII